MRRTASLLAAVLAGLTLAVGAPAGAYAGNAAVAINTKDGSSVFKFAFAIRHVAGAVVDETNAAVAYASCTACRTTAIAIEIVLVEGSPSTFTPTNQAIAINYRCTLCETFAAAYQFVVQGSGPMHFTHDALRELKDIRKEIRDLREQNLSPFELQQRLDPLIARLKRVLATGLVSGPPPDEESDGEDPSSTETAPSGEGGQTRTETAPEATATVPTESTPTTTADATTTTTPTTTTSLTTTTPVTTTTSTPTTTATTTTTP